MTSLGADGLLSVELTYAHWSAVMKMIYRLADHMSEAEKQASLILALQLQADVRDAMFATSNKTRTH